MGKKDNISTTAVHAGEDRKRPNSAITTPIFQTSTYSFDNTQELCDYMEGKIEREEYGRYGNPTQKAVEKKLAEMDNAEACLLFSSGMSAVTTTLLAMLGNGQHAVLTDDCYRRTRQFCRTVLTRLGVGVSIVKTGHYEELESAITPKTRLIISESPTNPYQNVLDLEQLVDVAKRKKVKVVIDSTFATPYNQNPLDFGIDIVIHSATKYLGGHNDLLAGAILGKREIVEAVKDMQSMLGGIPGPLSCYLLLRGLKTFPLRMEHQNNSGQKIAEWLEAHPKVKRVYYPGLASHPHHDIAKKQMRGFGGVVSFEINGSLKDGSRFIDALTIPYIAPSLGGVESLIEQPALMSFYELSTEERLAIGIKDNLIRFSIGVEDADDLIADLEQGLEKI